MMTTTPFGGPVQNFGGFPGFGFNGVNGWTPAFTNTPMNGGFTGFGWFPGAQTPWNSINAWTGQTPAWNGFGPNGFNWNRTGFNWGGPNWGGQNWGGTPGFTAGGFQGLGGFPNPGLFGGTGAFTPNFTNTTFASNGFFTPGFQGGFNPGFNGGFNTPGANGFFNPGFQGFGEGTMPGQYQGQYQGQFPGQFQGQNFPGGFTNPNGFNGQPGVTNNTPNNGQACFGFTGAPKYSSDAA